MYVCEMYVQTHSSIRKPPHNSCVCTYMYVCETPKPPRNSCVCTYMYVCEIYVQTHSSIRKPPCNSCVCTYMYVCETPKPPHNWCVCTHMYVCETPVMGWLSYGGMCLYIWRNMFVHVCVSRTHIHVRTHSSIRMCVSHTFLDVCTNTFLVHTTGVCTHIKSAHT